MSLVLSEGWGGGTWPGWGTPNLLPNPLPGQGCPRQDPEPDFWAGPVTGLGYPLLRKDLGPETREGTWDRDLGVPLALL